MGKKYSPEEQKVIETVINEAKKLVKKYGYEYVMVGCNKYFNTLKQKRKLLSEIKEKEKELEELKKKLV